MKRFIRVISVLLSLVLFISWSVCLEVVAVDIDNNGEYRTDVCGDSKIPASFTDVEYFDFYMPYNYNAGEIGGYSVAGTATMTESLQKRKPASFVNYEFDGFSNNYWQRFGVKQCGNTGVTEGYETDTGLATLTDKNGTVYYVTALPWILFKEGRNYYSDNDDNWGLYYNAGQVFDVILLDGTVIHFVMGCAKAEVHTNGGKQNGYSPDSESYTAYETKNLSKHPQYSNMFQAVGGETLEVWGKTSDAASFFMEKYGLLEHGGDGSNLIAYIRVYNTMIGDAPTPANDTVKAVSYNLGSVNITSSSSGNIGLSINDIAQRYDESYFLGNIAGLSERSIALPSADWLQYSEQQEIADWKNTIELLKEDEKFSFLRACVMLVGILIIVYSTLLFLAFQFDKINNFVDIEVLSMLTMGKMVTSRDDTSTYNDASETTKGKPKMIVQKDIFVVTITGIAIGVLLLTGKLYAIITLVVDLVKSVF